MRYFRRRLAPPQSSSIQLEDRPYRRRSIGALTEPLALPTHIAQHPMTLIVLAEGVVRALVGNRWHVSEGNGGRTMSGFGDCKPIAFRLADRLGGGRWCIASQVDDSVRHGWCICATRDIC